jgi:hypothetical protein
MLLLSLIVTSLFCSNLKLTKHYTDNVGRKTLVGIATCYGLYGLGIESLGVRFSAPVHTGPGAHPASYTMGTRSFPEVKRLKHGIDHPPPSSAEVKERVQLYAYSPSGPSWPVLGWTLLFYLHTDTIEPGQFTNIITAVKEFVSCLFSICHFFEMAEALQI